MIRKNLAAFLLLLLVATSMLLRSEATAAKQRQNIDQRITYLDLFAREVYWSGLKRQPHFYLEYIGAPSEFSESLKNYFERHKIRGKGVRVTITPDWVARNKILYPNLIFVSSKAMKHMEEICKFFENYPVLIVSEESYRENGWMISLNPKKSADGDLKQWSYNIDIANIKAFAGLSVSSRLIPRAQQIAAQNQQDKLPILTQEKKLEQEYATILQKQKITIAEREATILCMRDTISQQRITIDSLRTYNMSLARQSLLSIARKGLLWSHTPIAATSSHTVSEYTAHANTAPWRSDTMGLVIFSLLGLLSVSSVLLSSIVGWGGSSSTTKKIADTTLATMGVATFTEKRKHEKTMQESFLGNVSHELRTPLNAIVGLSQYVAATQNIDEEVRESLEVINSNAHGLMQMMNNILTLAMIQRNELKLNRKKINLPSFLLAIYENMSQRLQDKKREQECILLHSIRNAGDKPIYADEEKLRTVFELLISQKMLDNQFALCEFGAIERANKDCILYVRATNTFEKQDLKENSFSFQEKYLYKQNAQQDDITLNTVASLLSLMEADLYVNICQFEQMYYFCIVRENN